MILPDRAWFALEKTGLILVSARGAAFTGTAIVVVGSIDLPTETFFACHGVTFAACTRARVELGFGFSATGLNSCRCASSQIFT